MKIIFDSEEQREVFDILVLKQIDFCPSALGLTDMECGRLTDCNECWKHCGLEMEVKNE